MTSKITSKSSDQNDKINGGKPREFLSGIIAVIIRGGKGK